MVPPIDLCRSRIFSTSSVLPKTAPASISLWPAKILGAALQDQIHTELDGPLVIRRSESRIDKRKDFVLVGYLFDFHKVEDIQVRISWRFGKNEPRVFSDGPVDKSVIAERHNRAVNRELLQIRPAELQRLFVAVVGDDDVVAGMHKRQNRGGDCAHPR